MSEIASRYRKLPVEIEAVQLTQANAADVWGWVAPAVEAGQAVDVSIDIDKGLTISTLEGDMRASFGDWIIKGVKGEFYPCKPDIFAETYGFGADEPEPATVIVVTEASGQERRYNAPSVGSTADGTLVLGPRQLTAGLPSIVEPVAGYAPGRWATFRQDGALVSDDGSLRRLGARAYEVSADLGVTITALRQIRDSTVMIGTARSLAHAALTQIGFDSEDEADDSAADALDAQSLHDSPGSDL